MHCTLVANAQNCSRLLALAELVDVTWLVIVDLVLWMSRW
jgi:hypothetical protein